MSGIKKKFVSGVLWESIGRFSALGVQFIVTILIARILTPEDFGVIGLLAVFIALGQVLLDSGFSQALIQKKDASQIELSTVYFMNMAVGFLLYFILYACSPFIAEFYGVSDLTSYARVLFLIVPINAFGLVQNVIIQKELDFKKTALAGLLSAIGSGCIGIYMAYAGYGIWALVGQQLSIHTIRTLLYIIQRRWIPQLTLSFSVVKELFGFSMNLMFHSIVNTTMKNVYVLVIGKFFPVAQVGYYTQADKLQEISGGTLSGVVIKVSYPALVQKRDEPILLRQAYQKICSSTLFVIVPFMVLLICIAEPLFRLLLTATWLPAVPYFKILCGYGMLLPLLQISYNMYKLFKKGELLFWIDTLRHLVVLASILVTLSFGIEAMLYSLVGCTFIMTVFNLIKSGELIGWTLKEQIKSLVPYYILAGVVGAVVLMVPATGSDSLTIFLKTGVFSIIYLVGSHLLNLEGYKEIKGIGQGVLRKIRKKND